MPLIALPPMQGEQILGANPQPGAQSSRQPPAAPCMITATAITMPTFMEIRKPAATDGPSPMLCRLTHPLDHNYALLVFSTVALGAPVDRRCNRAYESFDLRLITRQIKRRIRKVGIAGEAVQCRDGFGRDNGIGLTGALRHNEQCLFGKAESSVDRGRIELSSTVATSSTCLPLERHDRLSCIRYNHNLRRTK